MKDFVIMADSSCDIEEELCGRKDIILIPCHIHTADGGDYLAHPSWEGTSAQEFYSGIKRSPDSCKTAPPNIYEFERKFEAAISQGKDILLMTLSSGMSGAYNFSLVARDNVLKRIPSAKIRIIDTLRFAPAFGLMVFKAVELRSQGYSLEETADYLEANKNRYHQAGWTDDLAFVAKKGRLTHAKAFFGTLAGVKPIAEFDYNGLPTVIGKAKGAKNAYSALLDYIANTIEDAENQSIIIAHTRREKEAEEYKRLISETIAVKEIIIKEIYPFNGINIGPGLMSAYYVGKPISQGLTEEKMILDRFLSGGKAQ